MLLHLKDRIIMRCRNNNNLSSCSLQHLIMPCNRKPQYISKITKCFIICIFRRGVDGLGHCNPVGGILLVVEDFCRRGLKEHGEPVSCTSRLCSWNAPTNVQVDRRVNSEALSQLSAELTVYKAVAIFCFIMCLHRQLL